MTDVYLYADETGDLDMTGAFGASRYFGFGTAVFADGHAIDGPIDLYRTAWYLHLTGVARKVSKPGDRMFAIVGTLQTHNKREAIRHAVVDVCAQVTDRLIVPCLWDAQSSWGIQVADYGLWATHRRFEGRDSPWFHTCIGPTLRSVLTPWGEHGESRLSQ